MIVYKRHELYLLLEMICFILLTQYFRSVWVYGEGIWHYSLCTYILYNYFIMEVMVSHVMTH
jgi:hypothetical protein